MIVGSTATVSGTPARRPAGLDHPVADAGGDEVGGHLLRLVPDKGALAVGGDLRDQPAVGDHALARRDRGPDRPGRLVARVVRQRHPGRGHVGLVAHERAVFGVQEAVGRAEHDRRADDRLRDPAVVDRHVEGRALPQAVERRDLQLLAVAVEGGGIVVHAHRADLELLQVEVQARQVLGGARPDDHGAVQPVGRRVVGEAQVVVPDVVAAVAFQREVGVADASPEATPQPS